MVDLGDDDTVAERGRLHQRRGVFGAGPGVQVAFTVGHEACHQGHVGDQIDQQPRVQLDISVDRADFEQAVFKQLANAQALWPREGKIQLAGDAALEQVQVLCTADAGHDHVQVVQAPRVDLGQRTREEVGLLLVVAFQHHAVAGGQQQFQCFDDTLAGQHRTVGKVPDLIEAALLFGTPSRPLRRWILCCCHGDSTGSLSWGHLRAGASRASIKLGAGSLR